LGQTTGIMSIGTFQTQRYFAGSITITGTGTIRV
jgi:hypothetical protein